MEDKDIAYYMYTEKTLLDALGIKFAEPLPDYQHILPVANFTEVTTSYIVRAQKSIAVSSPTDVQKLSARVSLSSIRAMCHRISDPFARKACGLLLFCIRPRIHSGLWCYSR